MGGEWDRLTVAAPHASIAVVVASAVLALALVGWPRAWRFARVGITLAHEGSHALAALVCGRSLHGMRIHRDTSGVTASRGPARGLGAVLTFGAGYPGPAVLGVLGAWLLRGGYPGLLLLAVLVVLVGMILQIRNWFGLLAVAACGGPVAAILWWCPPSVHMAVALVMVWLLLFGGLRTVVDLQHDRSAGGSAGGGQLSDADQLARLTPFPALLWVTVFALISVAAVLLGGALLWGELR
ncbi:M50 family metallopeptidase [Dermatophilaceae bacterium Sec6.4]